MPPYVFTGGTSVSEALTCPESETRMIVSLDTSQMVRMLSKYPIQVQESILEGDSRPFVWMLTRVNGEGNYNNITETHSYTGGKRKGHMFS